VAVTVNRTSGLVTTEANGIATFTIVLDSQPSDSVAIPLSSSDSGEGVVSSSSLLFATGNWATAQTVTLTGQDDDEVDGDIAYTITGGVFYSNDTNFNDTNFDGGALGDVNATNEDGKPQASIGTLIVDTK
jgi:hypothetical protein